VLAYVLASHEDAALRQLKELLAPFSVVFATQPSEEHFYLNLEEPVMTISSSSDKTYTDQDKANSVRTQALNHGCRRARRSPLAVI